MSDRALLTDWERDVLLGTAENADEYRSKARHHFKRRLDQLARDMEIVEEHEPELARELQLTVCGDEDDRIQELERRLRRLEDQTQD